MHLSESNVKCVFVQAGFPKGRYIHARKVSDNPCDPAYEEDKAAFEISERVGLYKESTTLLSYYERRGEENQVDKMCYAQFCKEYDPYRKKDKNRNKDNIEPSDSEEDCEDVLNEDVEEELRDEEDGIEEVKPKDRIHTSDDTAIYKLPNLIKLINIQRGEAPYMKRKRIPNAIRLHKIKDNSHESLYSAILLYRPFQNELVDLRAERERTKIYVKIHFYILLHQYC